MQTVEAGRKLRVAIYTRVSTDDQVREGYSLKTQAEMLIAHAEKQGWAIHYPEPNRIYQDDGYSAGNLNRPALQRLLRDAKARKFDVVLVYKVDRFCRNQRDFLNLLYEMGSVNVELKSATESFEVSTSSGRMLAQLLGSCAEFFRSQLTERIYPGMAESVRQGNWHGARYAPYGYYYWKEKRLLEPVPEEAKVVQLMNEMYLAGKSTAKIAGYLYEKGYKTRSGGLFGSKLVGDILKRRLYTGTLVWNRAHYDKKQKTRRGYRVVRNPSDRHVIAQGKHEPLISLEVFEAVQRKLRENAKGRTHRTNKHEYPLSGLLFCKQCLHRYLGTTGTASHKTKARKRWYRCMARSQHDIDCSNPAVSAEKIETELFGKFEVVLQHPVIKSGRIDQLVASQCETQDVELESVRFDLKEQIKVNLQKQSRLTRFCLEGNIAEEVFASELELIRADERSLKEKLTKVEMQMVQRERSAEYQFLLRQVINDYDTLKESEEPILDIVRKKELLRLVFKQVLIDDRQVASVELYEPFQTLYNDAIKQANTQNAKGLTETCKSSCILQLTDVR